MAVQRWRVVTGFLTRLTGHSREVLLFQRSQNVSTYKGKWAGISGTVEKGELPEQAMWRELEEETGFTASEAKLVRSGLPLDIDHQGRRFRVHPFLYQLHPNVTPKIDFEHTQFSWVAESEVANLDLKGDTVPQLLATYHRLADPPSVLDPKFQAGAREIFDDRTSGAAELAVKAAELVRQGADPIRVSALRPTMVAIVQASMAAAQTNSNIADDLKIDAARAMKTGTEIISAQKINTIATFSKSSTVIGALKNCARPLKVLIGRSEPGGEGILAADLIGGGGQKHEISVVDDGALCEVVGEGKVDAVVVGADAVMPNGDVVNKVGTRLLAEAAQRANVPFYVLADRWKVWPDTVPPPLESIFEVVSSTLGVTVRGGAEACLLPGSPLADLVFTP